MTKKKVKQQAKKSLPKILPEVYNWLYDNIQPIMMVSLILCAMSLFCLWTILDLTDTESLICLTLNGFNPWVILAVLIVISELIFAWIFNNDISSTDMGEIIAGKILSLSLSFVVTFLLFSAIVLLRMLSWSAIWNVVSFFGIGIILYGGVYVYLKINQWIARKVQSQ